MHAGMHSAENFENLTLNVELSPTITLTELEKVESTYETKVKLRNHWTHLG